MSRKFAMVPVFAVAGVVIFFAATGSAQQTPADQTPATQAPTTQAPANPTPAAQTPATTSDNTQEAEEESPTKRKSRPRNFDKWTFNAGAGAEAANGTTRTFVKAGGLLGTVGAARNANQWLGLRADFFWVNLPLRDSALELAQAPSAHNSVLAFTIDPIINIPVTKKYGGYVLIGPGFYHRSGELDSSTKVPGAACNGFFTWWGACTNDSVPLSGDFLKSNQNAFGLNFGGGVTRKLSGKIELYAEFRYFHGNNNNITTDLRPITVGVRW